MAKLCGLKKLLSKQSILMAMPINHAFALISIALHNSEEFNLYFLTHSL